MLVESPRLRPGIVAIQDPSSPHYVFLFDQSRLAKRPQRLTVLEMLWVQLFDGRRTLNDIQTESMRQVGGTLLPREWIVNLVERLDEGLFLDSPRLQQYLENPIREPACLGTYASEPDALRRQLRGLFTDPRGPGLPRETKPDGRLRAALLPHIDYGRGGHSYAWGFREVFERTDASLFVIIGTSHCSPQRYTLTTKHFKTPLGIAHTDHAYIERLVGHYGDGLFEDELRAHMPEWSIELEVVFLQFLYEGRRDIRIVPLVVGTFGDCILEQGVPPTERDNIGRMIQALRQAEAETPEPICYIISGDLAHIGPYFGDDGLEDDFLAHSRAQDQAILHQAEAADPAGYFRVIAEERDGRRICGLPPTYTTLEALRPREGKILHYDQYVDPQRDQSVSFASVAFYR